MSTDTPRYNEPIESTHKHSLYRGFVVHIRYPTVSGVPKSIRYTWVYCIEMYLCSTYSDTHLDEAYRRKAAVPDLPFWTIFSPATWRILATSSSVPAAPATGLPILDKALDNFALDFHQALHIAYYGPSLEGLPPGWLPAAFEAEPHRSYFGKARHSTSNSTPTISNSTHSAMNGSTDPHSFDDNTRTTSADACESSSKSENAGSTTIPPHVSNNPSAEPASSAWSHRDVLQLVSGRTVLGAVRVQHQDLLSANAGTASPLNFQINMFVVSTFMQDVEFWSLI